MTRPALSTLEGAAFDAVVIGGGVNGASAAQHLSAAGYTVLLVDKGDFAAGSSSRSSRLLHCGLRFLEPGEGLGYRQPSVWDIFRDPLGYATQVRRARDAMRCRADIAGTMPERVQAFTFYFPTYRGGPYRPWQVGAAVRALALLGPRGGPELDYHRVSPREAAARPLLRWLRDLEDLTGVAAFREYRYEWPERICLDTLMDAARLGAVVRNYTPVVGLARDNDAWRVTLADALEEDARAGVLAKFVLNVTGIWTDGVNRLAATGAPRKIRGTKGSHIMFRLPPECADLGVVAHTRERDPLYLVPWRGLHYAGPTDTPYEGDLDDVRASEEEIEHLIAETNHLLPGIALTREQVLFSWAGVRPLTYSEDEAMGLRGHRLHDLTGDGLPNVFNMTSSPILSHRLAGAQLCEAVARRAPPSRAPQSASFHAKLAPGSDGSPALLNHWRGATLADLRHAAEHEQPVTLADLLFRRVGAGWTETMGREGARVAAETVADILGWDEARIDREVDDYLAHLAHRYGVTIEAEAG